MNSNTAPGFTYVNTAEALKQLTEGLQTVSRVGLDVEADGLHHYFEKVCLIQLSFLGKNYVIDPLADLSLTAFLAVLAQKELIIHAADYDLRMLKKTYGFRPNGRIFDTMLAAQVLGYDKIGLAALVEKFFNVVLPKTGQKADWSRRPLTPELLAYASDDTKYLEALADALTENLKPLDRVKWHQECCARVAVSSGLPDKSEAKEGWRVKGSSKLAPNVLVFLREIWKWRDSEAQRKDRPPFMIMHNEDLIELAEWRSKHVGAPLQHGPAFLKRFDGEIYARLQNAVRTADTLPQAEWPAVQEKPSWRDHAPSADKVEPLMAACKVLAEKLKIEPSFLASRATLTAVAQYKPESVERVMEVSGMMQWQAELMMPTIQSVLGFPTKS